MAPVRRSSTSSESVRQSDRTAPNNPARSNGSTSAGGAPGLGLTRPTTARRGQRRTRRLVFGALLIVVCAVLGYFAWQQVSTTESVVATRTLIPKGSVITRDELTVRQVNADSGLQVIPSTQVSSLIGRQAASDIPAGSIVPTGATASGPMAKDGQSLVGILVKPGGAPITGMEPGSRVRMLGLAAPEGQDATDGGTTGGTTGDATGDSPTAQLPEVKGLVVRVTQVADGSGTSVDVAVDAAYAAEMQRLAAAGKVAIVVDSER